MLHVVEGCLEEVSQLTVTSHLSWRAEVTCSQLSRLSRALALIDLEVSVKLYLEPFDFDRMPHRVSQWLQGAWKSRPASGCSPSEAHLGIYYIVV